MTDLNIGDPAYASFGKYGRINVKHGKVVKITPTGQIVIDFGEKQPRRFKGQREMGATWDMCGNLISREVYEKLSAQQALHQHLGGALVVCRNARIAKVEDLDAVIEKLTKLRASLPLNGGGAA